MPQHPVLYALLLGAVVCLVIALKILVRGALYKPRKKPKPLRLQVSARNNHGAADLFSFVVRRPWYARWRPLPRFSSGQSVSLALPGQKLKRRYSLARWHHSPRFYELGIRLENQGRFTPELYSHAQSGAWLDVEPPSGHFVLPSSPKPVAVMIAGGIGITPLLAMIDEWRNNRSDIECVHLYWQVRHTHEWIYEDELSRLAKSCPTLHVNYLASRPTSGIGQRLSVNDLLQNLDQTGYDRTKLGFYICAGNSLLDAVTQELENNGIASDAIHFERFGIHINSNATGSFELEIDNQKIQFDGHQNLLEALEDGDIAISSDCRTGTCGECRVHCISGQVEQLINPEFQCNANQFLACCVLPLSDLKISVI